MDGLASLLTDARDATLKKSRGFRRYLQSYAQSIYIVGTVQRHKHKNMMLHAEGTMAQLDNLRSWLRVCQQQGMLKDLIPSRQQIHDRSFDNFAILCDLTRKQPVANPEGVITGRFSGADREKLSEFSFAKSSSGSGNSGGSESRGFGHDRGSGGGGRGPSKLAAAGAAVMGAASDSSSSRKHAGNHH